MSATVLEYTFGTTDRGVKLSEGEIIRPWKDDSWTTIRVGVRFCALDDTGSAPTAGSSLLFGVCSGSTNTVTSATTDHAILVGNSYGAGSAGYTSSTFSDADAFGARYGTPNPRIIKKENSSTGVYTVGSTVGLSFIGNTASSATFFSCVASLDITRAATYTFRYCVPDIGTGTVDVITTSQADFLAQMTASSPSLSRHTTSSVINSTTTIDEATYGTLDHVTFSWNRAAPTMFIQDIIVVKLA